MAVVALSDLDVEEPTHLRAATDTLIIYGILILLVCMWRPSGILSLFEERVRRRAGGKT